jgi:hypothetical protein
MAPSLLPLITLALSSLLVQITAMATSASDDFVMPVLGKIRQLNMCIMHTHYNMYWLLEKRVKRAFAGFTLKPFMKA